jgi:hypothetical protein
MPASATGHIKIQKTGDLSEMHTSVSEVATFKLEKDVLSFGKPDL